MNKNITKSLETHICSSYRHTGFFETVGEYLKKYYKTIDLESIYLMVKRELGKRVSIISYVTFFLLIIFD